MLLCQCAIGDGWNDKSIRLAKREPFVTFAVQPLTAAAFPFVPAAMQSMANDVGYEYLSKSVVLWFDRLRLVKYIDEGVIDGGLRNAMLAYVSKLLFGDTPDLTI